MTLNMIKFFEENGFHCQPEFIPKLLIVDYQNITSPLLLNIIDKFSSKRQKLFEITILHRTDKTFEQLITVCAHKVLEIVKSF